MTEDDDRDDLQGVTADPRAKADRARLARLLDPLRPTSWPRRGVLNDARQVVPLDISQHDDLLIWANFMEDVERRTVGRDEIQNALISTVFLANNTSFFTTPRWFETMVFTRTDSVIVARYQTWDDAELGHEIVVNWVREHGWASDASMPALLEEQLLKAVK